MACLHGLWPHFRTIKIVPEENTISKRFSNVNHFSSQIYKMSRSHFLFSCEITICSRIFLNFFFKGSQLKTFPPGKASSSKLSYRARLILEGSRLSITRAASANQNVVNSILHPIPEEYSHHCLVHKPDDSNRATDCSTPNEPFPNKQRPMSSDDERCQPLSDQANHIHLQAGIGPDT